MLCEECREPRADVVVIDGRTHYLCEFCAKVLKQLSMQTKKTRKLAEGFDLMGGEE